MAACSFRSWPCKLVYTELCAAQALCGEDTVVRSQLVTAHALQTEMYGKIDSVLSGAQGNKSVIVLERLWDETSTRLQVSESALRTLVGNNFAAECVKLKKRGRGGRGSVYPSYFVQIMQQMGFIRWGRSRQEGCELILPAKICATTSADSIWNALLQSAPHLTPARLEEVAQRVRAMVVYQFPDGLAGNRVVMQAMAELCPSALFLPSHLSDCFGSYSKLDPQRLLRSAPSCRCRRVQ